ncbi:YybH family protein [Pusillimonas minor]|uniref:SgcJ/EcaC family oxidoreductase n=1 Tax=Pusillimonas minor TaxID=2697024 RepID=A0A842HIC0_9BURK|nr:SgcJ/EcaC family oxidoreductase [Pusillimonas minor]MBC2768369.1 SgcJ/EcaC family oxidoreductase [Pusillimonas minor]
MLNTRRITASVLLSLALIPTFSNASASSVENTILQTLSRYESALNAGDIATIVDLYMPDGVQMAPDAPAAVGAPAVRAAYNGTFKAVAFNLDFEVDEVKVLSENTALLRTHSAGTVKVNGTDQPAAPAAFKELFVLQKQADGQWKFSHYGFSSSPLKP